MARSRADDENSGIQTDESPESDSQVVYARIRDDILEGRLEPGEVLVESRLARDYDVSRTPVREALARLVAEHIVGSGKKRGLVVRTLDRADLEDQYEIRGLLEGYAVLVATNNLTAQEMSRLRSILAEMETCAADTGESAHEEVVRRMTVLNNEFHALIVAAARSPVLERLVRTVVEIPLVRQSFRHYTGVELRASAQDHAAILDAFERADGEEAQRIMQRHVHRGLNVLLAHNGDRDAERSGRAMQDRS